MCPASVVFLLVGLGAQVVHGAIANELEMQ